MTENTIHIFDDDNIVGLLPAFIRNLFLRKYHQQGLIQMDGKTRELTVCGDLIIWLDKLSVETTSIKRANRLMFKYLNENYPQYKYYIQLF